MKMGQATMVSLGLCLAFAWAQAEAASSNDLASTYGGEANQVPCGYGFQMSVAPASPTEEDIISVTSAGDWPNSCIPGYRSHQVANNVIQIDLEYDAIGPCLDVIMPWTSTVELGPLSSGVYRIDVYLNSQLGATLCGSQPLTVIPATLPLDVVVDEIAWMGTTISPNDEWIELYNNTDSPVDLTGWSLTAADGTPNIPLSGAIPAGSYFLLERTNDDSVPGVTRDLLYSGALENEGEDLVLRDSACNVIDRVDCTAGWFAGHNEARVPMVRVDTSANGTWASNWTHNPRCGTATSSAGISRTCTLTVTNVGQPLDYALYFNERFTATTTTLDHTLMEDALLGLIDGATTSIDVALYGLNRQSVVTALIAAHNSGVTVRVVGDDEAASGDYSASYQALTNAGVPVVVDASTSKIQHNKFLIMDGEVVWTGSTNFTDTGLTLNANNSIVITDTMLAGVYLVEFEEMWAGSLHEEKADNTPHLLD
jgi:hypothetical protein